ncbi:MAG: DUF4153 domain-containing protein [Syntrophomonadaceae bacterium]|nr:DUF4153 domain-containing protein [Syntrophomonadaceae bacterium]
MKRWGQTMVNMVRGLLQAVSRFPLTVLCLIGTTGLVCYMISLHKAPDLIIQKLMFTFLLGSFLGVAAQFSCERFKRLQQLRLAVYVLSALLIAGYYWIIRPVPNIDIAVSVRTMVAVFAMFCAFIWVPSFRGRYDFNKIALIHFKSAFISVLYSGVLSAGCASIIGAIDILLFKVNQDTYGYTMAVIWILFATLYYLSLLPRFNSDNEIDRDYTADAEHYPKFLEILVSYIAIPLVAAFTLVLAAYFIKILATLKWPVGQLGPMVLGYSAAGLIIYVLASLLTNRSARLYQRIFPLALIPVVIMQLVSVGIRLNAYGFTESRYYVALFGVFAIVCGVFLSAKPVVRNGLIAVLAAGFAIFSVIPPVDAFTVSRVSQITRLENILSTEGILSAGKINPKPDASLNVRLETTSILNYLDSRNYTKYLAWLPADFKTYDKMESTFGFEPAYQGIDSQNFFYANLDMQQPSNISGFDMMFNINSYRRMPASDEPRYDFEVRGVKYSLTAERLSSQEVLVAVKDANGAELISTGLYDFVKSLPSVTDSPKSALSSEDMTLNVEKDGCKLRIVLQNISMTYSGDDAGVDYSGLVLFGAP